MGACSGDFADRVVQLWRANARTAEREQMSPRVDDPCDPQGIKTTAPPAMASAAMSDGCHGHNLTTDVIREGASCLPAADTSQLPQTSRHPPGVVHGGQRPRREIHRRGTGAGPLTVFDTSASRAGRGPLRNLVIGGFAVGGGSVGGG
jgi:hypothetical protein